MPGTSIVDMRHYIPDDATELTPEAMRMRDYLGRIVQAATAQHRRKFISGLPCRRRPANRPCLGTIAVHTTDLPRPVIFWECVRCGDNGQISCFLDCPYDLGAFTRPCENDEKQRLDVALTAQEYASWISGDMISYDIESMRIIYSATASKGRVAISIPDTERETLYDSTAADANHESNRKRQRTVYAIFNKIGDTLEKTIVQPSVRSRSRNSGRSDGMMPGFQDPGSSYAHGFFSAVVAGPMVMPTAWLPRFLAAEIESLDELNKDAQSVMGAYNKVADSLLGRREQFGNEMLAIARRDADGSALIDWHRGFLDAMSLNPDQWKLLLSRFGRDDILQPLAMMSEFSEDPDKRSWLREQSLREDTGRSLGVMTARLWEAYRGEPMVELKLERAQPRVAPSTVARNAPCPCGNGKKYKLCCGSTLRIV